MAFLQTFGMATDSERDHHTVAELLIFRKLVKSHTISFFRIGKCVECDGEIHKAKKYCSKECKSIHEGTEAIEEYEED